MTQNEQYRAYLAKLMVLLKYAKYIPLILPIVGAAATLIEDLRDDVPGVQKAEEVAITVQTTLAKAGITIPKDAVLILIDVVVATYNLTGRFSKK